MDSCTSSPSHFFKDRRPSRHSDLARQPSFSHSFERTPSPAPMSEPKEFYNGAARDLASRSHGSSEKEDALVSSPDRGRNSLRTSIGFEQRMGRHRDWKTERPLTPRGNLDKDSAETGGGRLPGIRKISDGYKHEIVEGVSSSSLYRERDLGGFSRKAYDRERGDIRQRGSSSPECGMDSVKSPKGYTLSRDAFKSSLMRPDVVDRDGSAQHAFRKSSGFEMDHIRTSHSSPKDKDYVHDMDGRLQKTRGIKGGGQDKEQAAAFNDTHTMSWSVSSTSLRGRGDVMKDDQCPDTNWDRENRERTPPPLPFSHVSKKARSDRDRSRQEDGKVTIRGAYSMESFLAETSADKVDMDDNNEVMGKANYGRESLAQNKETANERHVDEMEVERPPILNKWDDSDMEEGELEPESHPDNRARDQLTTSIRDQGHLDSKEGKESDVPIVVGEGKDVSEGILSVVLKVENELDAHGDRSGDAQVQIDEICDMRDLSASPPEKEENVKSALENDIGNLQHTDHRKAVSPIKVSDVICANSKGGSTLDLLDTTREEAERRTLNAADKGHDSDKDLRLSLFAKPGGVRESAGTRLEENTLEGQTITKEQQYGKQTESTHNSELAIAMGRPHFGRSGEESSQHAGYAQKKLNMESLQLSLALPGVSVAGVRPDQLRGMAGSTIELERSFQSLDRARTHTQNNSPSQTYTNSDGFTSSFSFSQSQSLIHNPSCSLNCTSVENQELSCGGSRQVSQGTEQMSQRSWPGFSGNEHTVTSVSQERSRNRRGIPLYQRVLQNGNVSQGFPSVTGSNRTSGSNHISQRGYHSGQRLQEPPRILDSSLQDLEVSARKMSTHRDIMERVRQQKAWFAQRQQAMAREPRSEANAVPVRNRLVDPTPSNVKGTTSGIKEDAINASSDRIGLHEITTEPVSVMAQKLQELPDSFLEGLKGIAKGVLCSFEKRNEFISLQENIRERMDLTEESLLRSHRTQLEILVALKTGMQAYVQEGSKPQTYKALIEIFLQTKCRNMACQQSLPVFGCECKICSKKGGFCHECMCIVCFKFDTEFHTCRWVGCDVCLHWCHTDCGLRMSYITPTTSSGVSEMQYHCAACEHKSQLFGFIKEVFQKCAEGWGAETLAKELDCVRRIFHGSEDMRGKQLCWKAEQMLQKLENKVSAAEVCRSMLRFFTEGNAELDGACGLNKKPVASKLNDASAKLADSVRDIMPKTTSSASAKLADSARDVMPKAMELQYDRVRKRAEMEDMESVVRMKQAEAKMFQVRADEARQEAGGLQRIIAVKQEKVNDEYACKYAKLKLKEAEERQQKQVEELKVLETAQQEFQKMKVRTEAEIKELMRKMEMAKRQFT